MKLIENLQYITTSKASNVLDEVMSVCEAGIHWIQLRLKNSSKQEIEKIAIQAKKICDKYKVTFIVNDDVEIAKKINADGVHIGKNDMSVKDARKILGEDKIIGGTANTFEDCKILINSDVDYIGLGPFRFTNTKKKLSPIVGLQGYIQTIQKINKEGLNTTPIVGVGGIELGDVKPITESGIFGIALSGLIANSDNKEKLISELKENLKK